MLISSVIFVLSDLPYPALSDRLIVNVPFTPRPTGIPFIPEEPSTLALALVGIVIIAAYVAVTRRVRLRVGRVSVRSTKVSIDTPTREAA
jgi:hypothetical protein